MPNPSYAGLKSRVQPSQAEPARVCWITPWNNGANTTLASHQICLKQHLRKLLLPYLLFTAFFICMKSLSFILINPCSHLKATFDLRSATSECSVFTFIEFRLVECYKQVYWVIYIYCQCTNKLLCSHLDSLSRFSQSNELVICNHHTLIYITFPQTVTSCTHCWPYSAYNKDSPT